MSLVGFLVRRSWRLVVLAIAAGVISGLGSAALIVVIQAAAGGGADTATIASFVGLAAATVASKAVAEVLLTRFGQATIAEVRIALSRRILATPQARLEELGGHRLLAALSDDAAVVATALVQVPQICISGATVVGCLVYLGWLSPPVLLAVVAAVVVGVATFQLHQRATIRRFEQARDASDALYGHFRALVAGSKELKLLGDRGERFVAEQLGGSVASYRDHFVAGMTTFSVASGWATVPYYAVLGVAVLALPAWTGLGAAEVGGVVLALVLLLAPLAQLVEVMPAVSRADVAVERWQALGLALEDGAGAAPSAPSTAPTASWRRLELAGVTHRYRRDGDDFCVGPIDLAFVPGELVFLVGGNGSGKSTLALVLLGLYHPEAGELRVDGVAIDDGNRDAYRQLFSAVFAEPQLFPELVHLDDALRLERARRYLARLQLEHRVRIVDGALVAGGLSQGQRKRFALLLAVLDDRPFYVFDEWAADQDPQFRNVFYTELLPELRARGKTILAITHDDTYFGLADRCLRMDFGQLTDVGAPAHGHRHPPIRSTP